MRAYTEELDRVVRHHAQRDRVTMEIRALQGHVQPYQGVDAVQVHRASHMGVAVTIERVDLTPGVPDRSANMLVLLGPRFPHLPPGGWYLNRPYGLSQIPHFFRAGVHHRRGIDLSALGFYWICQYPADRDWVVGAHAVLPGLFDATVHALRAAEES